jgi:hypothetical protein
LTWERKKVSQKDKTLLWIFGREGKGIWLARFRKIDKKTLTIIKYCFRITSHEKKGGEINEKEKESKFGFRDQKDKQVHY